MWLIYRLRLIAQAVADIRKYNPDIDMTTIRLASGWPDDFRAGQELNLTTMNYQTFFASFAPSTRSIP